VDECKPLLRGASPFFAALMDAGMRDSESGEIKLSAEEYPPPIVRAGTLDKYE